LPIENVWADGILQFLKIVILQWSKEWYSADFMILFTYRENCSFDELIKNVEKEILDEVDEKHHSRSWGYFGERLFINFLNGRRLRIKQEIFP
jgi:hypothetical protein